MIQPAFESLAPPIPSTAKDVLRSNDVDHHAKTMASINLEQSYQQLFGGPFEGTMHTVRAGPITIFRETLNQTAFQTGCANADHLTFASACTISKPIYWNGKHINEDSVLAFAPGREFELRSSDNSTCVGISLPVQLFGVLDPEKPMDYWAKTFSSMDCWTEHGGSSFLGDKLSGFLDRESGRPDASIDSAVFSNAVESVLDFMSETLARRQAIDATLRVDCYPRIARKARELMVEKLGEPLSISDICRTIGCSRRALQYAFESVYDVKPLTYLRLLRLERAHKLLLSQPDATVQDSAEAFGFHHLPRFAQHYLTMFGELPSSTLRRRKQVAMCGVGGSSPHLNA